MTSHEAAELLGTVAIPLGVMLGIFIAWVTS